MTVRKRFGQHFLNDESVIASIMDAVELKPDDHFVEIGPGTGALTKRLVARNATVTAIEIDRDLAHELGKTLNRVELIESDVLLVPASKFQGKRILGNLPYNISTPMLLKMCDIEEVVDAHFMLQTEVAQRLTAEVGTKAWGRLSVRIRYAFRVSRLFDVKPESFTPPPQVMSTFVRLQPYERSLSARNPAIFEAMVRDAFSQRRKKISNSLKAFDIDWNAQTIKSAARADQLGVSDYVDLANSVS